MRIGIDLGGSHLGIGALNGDGKLLYTEEKDFTQEEKNNIKEVIIKEIINKVKKLEKEINIDSIGIGVPGSTDERNIIKAVNFGITNFPIVDELRKKINYPIKIKNDAKCAAIAENEFGCLKKYNNAIFLTIGTGIGGAIIHNRQLLEMGPFGGGEFGHMIIEKDGRECKCGKKGCFEKYASMKVLRKELVECLKTKEDMSGAEIRKIVKTEIVSNENVRAVLENYLEYLAIGISNLVNILEPEAIGMGGSFAYWDEILIPILKYKLISKNYLFNKRSNIDINPAILGNDAGIIGAALL